MNHSDRYSVRLGIGSYAFAWAAGVAGHIPQRPLTALHLLEKAVQLDVGVVQICDNMPLDAMPEREFDAFCRAAERMKIAIEVGTRGIAAEHLRRCIGLAARAGSPILRVVIDTASHRPPLGEVVELLRPMRGDLERAGVCLAIENHDRFTARQFREIVERLDSPQFGICLDTVNSFGALEGPETVVSTLAPYVVNLHVKDFVIHRVDHQMGFVIEGCPAGQGRLDTPWLLEQLGGTGRSFSAILEQWPRLEGSLEETIDKEDRWASESVRYLRGLIFN